MKQITVFTLGMLALTGVLEVWLELADHEANMVTNRAWVERMPKDKKDVVSWFVPMQIRGKRFGVLQRNSHYWFAGERFTWTQQSDRLNLTFQQSDRRVQLKAKAYACRDHGFELCLDLTSGGQKITLYSKKKWRVPAEGIDALPAFDTTPLEPARCEACSDTLPDALGTLLRPTGSPQP
ncbi:MAG TPA: hypothetical protein ENK18_12605 [Deltaproteobacteria bacterium]|nr:hypothetical protein [Deltaproteobacteria bacterium]